MCKIKQNELDCRDTAPLKSLLDTSSYPVFTVVGNVTHAGTLLYILIVISLYSTDS